MAPARKAKKKPASKKAASRKKTGTSKAKKAASKKKPASKAATKKTAKKKAPAKKTARKAAAKKPAAGKKEAAASKKAGARKAEPRRARRAPAIRSRKAAETSGMHAALGGDSVRKSKHGQKWTCFACGKKFYDLNAPEPICPSCGANQLDKPKETAPAAPKPAKKASGRSRDARSLAPYLDDDDGSTRKESLSSEEMELEFGGVAGDDDLGEAFDDDSVVLDTVEED